MDVFHVLNCTNGNKSRNASHIETAFLISKPVVLGSVNNILFICDVLRDLVPFLQFKKREKHL